jgi:arylsulfatase A-like enzyme
LTDEAIRILKDGVYANAPLFLSLNFYNVHTPIEAPDSLVSYYKQKIEELGAKCNPIYAAMNHIVDRNVGRVLKTIHELGIEDNTVLIFTSDHGGYLGPYRGMKVADNSPLRSGKGSLYEGGIRMPLIIKFPGMSKEGTVCHTPVITNDFYPTFFEFAGIDTDTFRFDGLSLVPLIQNPAADLARDDLFWHYPHYYTTTTPVSAVRHKEWKLLKYYEDNRLELYNLEKDIGERNNLSSEYPDIRARMVNKLDEWLLETDAWCTAINPAYFENK